MLGLRLLTWDVLDTLLRLRRPVALSYAAEARCHGVELRPDALSCSFRAAYTAHSRQYPNYGLGQGLSSRQWWLHVVKETFRLVGVREETLLAQMAENLYRDYCSPNNWELLPGAAHTLSRCRQLGLRMGVVSNFDNRLHEILQRCHLRHLFHFVLTSEAAGVAKPDPEMFRMALRLGAALPEHAAHIGDDYSRDYMAARQVGMHSFLLHSNGHSTERDVPPGHVLPTLSHILTVIDKG